MENKLFNLAILQFGVSFILSILSIFLTIKILNKFVRKKNEIEYDNFAYAIFLSGVLFSVTFLVSEISSPIMNTIRFLRETTSGKDLYFEAIKKASIYFSIMLLTALIINIVSVLIFKYLTKGINLFEKIKENNIAIALIAVIIILTFTLLLKDSVVMVVESFIPYPEMPNLF